MAQVSIVVEETIDNYATWSHVFQGANGTWLFFDTRQIFGNFFIGLQGQTQNAWNTQIPPGSTILSATMEFTGFQNGAGFFGSLYRTTMSSPDRALQTQQQDPIQRPFEVFEGRRRDQWTNADVVVLSTTFTTIAAPATGAANQSVALRGMISLGGTIPNNTRLEQRITAAAGNTTIASVTWRLLRSAVAPAGNVRLRIQGVTIDRGVTIADGVDLAVSNPVAMGSITTAAVGAGVPFTFPGSVSLVAGQQYFLVLDPDPYPAAPFPFSTTSFIVSRNYNAFLQDGQLYHYGEGLSFDWQNYPGVVDLATSVVSATQDIIPGGIQWPVGTVAVNQLETSPDISALIQAQVDMPNYTADSGIIVTLSRGSAPAHGRVMCSNYHPTNPGPVLRITYDEPVPVVPPSGLADPRTPGKEQKPPGWEPFDLSYFRTKYQRQLELQRLRDQDLEEVLRETEQPTPDNVNLDVERLQLYLERIEARAQRMAESMERMAENAELATLEAEIALVEARGAEQRALLEQLEQNRIDAREALLMAMHLQRRQHNELAAIAATMQYFY